MILVHTLGGPISLIFDDRAIDRESGWYCLGGFVVAAVILYLIRKTWVRLPLATLMVLAWWLIGFASLGPV